MKTLTEFLNESVTIDVDYVASSNDAKKQSKAYSIKITTKKSGTADISGDAKKIVKFLTSKDYDMDLSDVKELYPELF